MLRPRVSPFARLMVSMLLPPAKRRLAMALGQDRGQVGADGGLGHAQMAARAAVGGMSSRACACPNPEYAGGSSTGSAVQRRRAAALRPRRSRAAVPKGNAIVSHRLASRCFDN
jgi:hypothetical protein